MALINRPGAGLPRAPVTVELDDIQATVLRYRPEPYYGTHIMLYVDEAQAGRELDSGRNWLRVASRSRGSGRLQGMTGTQQFEAIVSAHGGAGPRCSGRSCGTRQYGKEPR